MFLLLHYSPYLTSMQVVSCFCAALCANRCTERQTNPQPVLVRLGTQPSSMDLTPSAALQQTVQLQYEHASYQPMLQQASGATSFVAADYRPFWLGNRLMVAHWVKLFYHTGPAAGAAAGARRGGNGEGRQEMQRRRAQQRRQTDGSGTIGGNGGGKGGGDRRLAAGGVSVEHPVFPDHPAAGRECLFLAGHSCEFNVLSEVDLERGTMRLVSGTQGREGAVQLQEMCKCWLTSVPMWHRAQ